MHLPWYRFPLQCGRKITLQLLPFAEVLDNTVKQIVHPDEGESEIPSWLQLEILGHSFVHIQLQIYSGHFLLEHSFRHGKQHRSAAIKLFVLVIRATVRTIVSSIRRQRCPFVIQHSKHYDSPLHKRRVEHVGPWHVQLFNRVNITEFSGRCAKNIGYVDWFRRVIFTSVEIRCFIVNMSCWWNIYLWKGFCSFFYEWLRAVKHTSWSFHALKIQILKEEEETVVWYFLILYDVSLRSYVTTSPYTRHYVTGTERVRFKNFRKIAMSANLMYKKLSNHIYMRL